MLNKSETDSIKENFSLQLHSFMHLRSNSIVNPSDWKLYNIRGINGKKETISWQFTFKKESKYISFRLKHIPRSLTQEERLDLRRYICMICEQHGFKHLLHIFQPKSSNA